MKMYVCDVEMNHTLQKYSRHFEIDRLQHEIFASKFAAWDAVGVVATTYVSDTRCANAPSTIYNTQNTSYYFIANVNINDVGVYV